MLSTTDESVLRKRTHLDMQDGVANLVPALPTLTTSGGQGRERRFRLTAHSSASVQTLTRSEYTFSISVASKKCVADLVATTWTSTLSCCPGQRKVREVPPSEHNLSGRTLSSSRTMRGALMLATLPETARRTCKLRAGKTTGLRSSSPFAPSPFGSKRAIVCLRSSVASI